MEEITFPKVDNDYLILNETKEYENQCKVKAIKNSDVYKGLVKGLSRRVYHSDNKGTYYEITSDYNNYKLIMLLGEIDRPLSDNYDDYLNSGVVFIEGYLVDTYYSNKQYLTSINPNYTVSNYIERFVLELYNQVMSDHERYLKYTNNTHNNYIHIKNMLSYNFERINNFHILDFDGNKIVVRYDKHTSTFDIETLEECTR